MSKKYIYLKSMAYESLINDVQGIGDQIPSKLVASKLTKICFQKIVDVGFLSESGRTIMITSMFVGWFIDNSGLEIQISARTSFEVIWWSASVLIIYQTDVTCATGLCSVGMPFEFFLAVLSLQEIISHTITNFDITRFVFWGIIVVYVVGMTCKWRKF